VTRVFYLLGDPVAHSVSPAIHGAVFDSWGVDARYRARRVAAADVERLMREIAGAGGGGNVTLPHKIEAARALDLRSPAVSETGACNCFWDENGALAGDNTDVGGLDAALDELGVELAGRAALLLGAGGAARAALAVFRGRGAARVDIRNRTTARARELVEAVAWAGARVADSVSGERYAVVVNATRLGLRPHDPAPADLDRIRTDAVYDMVYGPGPTALVRAARARGIPAAGGLPMLIQQAALSLARWFPDRRPPLDTMRRAAERALSGADDPDR
jgi:shikimate dehydrogenase